MDKDEIIMLNRITPTYFNKPGKNHYLVFGSNNQGRHGKGSAKLALDKFGAIYGQASGLQGNSYGIITKDLRVGKRSIPLKDIEKEILEFIEFAKLNPDLLFYIVELGCSLAGFKVEEIAHFFEAAIDIENIYLPRRFWNYLKPNKQSDNKLF